MKKLENRLRTGLVSEAEAWQDPSPVIATTLTRTRSGAMAAILGAAAVLVLIGGVALLARPAGDGQTPSAGNDGIPPTTMTIADAEPAPEWGALVDEGLALISWTPGVSSAYATTGASRDEQTLTAVVRSADTDQLLLTVSYESFEDLEEAEAWPREAALDNGEVTLFGMLYSTAELGRPALFLVKPVGVIAVQVEDAAAAANTTAESLRTLILHLGAGVDVEGLSDTAFESPFEAIPFSGETWQFFVAEGPNPPTDMYKVCYSFLAPGERTEASGLGASGCGDWPGDTGQFDTGQFFVSLGPAMEVDGGVVFLVDLTSNPVAKVRIVGSGGDIIEMTPFRMPGSGKQFAVIELPHKAAPVTVEVLDEAGTVLDRFAGLNWSAEDPFIVPEHAGDERPLSDETAPDTAPVLAPMAAGVTQYDMDAAQYEALTRGVVFLGGGSSQGTPWAIVGRVLDDGDKPRSLCTGVRPLVNEDVCTPIDRSIWTAVYPVGNAGIVVFRPTQDAVAVVVTFDDGGAVEIPVVGVAEGYPAIAVISVDRVGQAGSAISINEDREMIDMVRWEVTGFFEPEG